VHHTESLQKMRHPGQVQHQCLCALLVPPSPLCDERPVALPWTDLPSAPYGNAGTKRVEARIMRNNRRDGRGLRGQEKGRNEGDGAKALGKAGLAVLLAFGLPAVDAPVKARKATAPASYGRTPSPSQSSTVRSAAYYGMKEAERSDRLLRDVMLSVHNQERRRFDLPPLIWDSALAADAAQYADQMARTALFRHSAKATRAIASGENLWMGPRRLYSYEVMVDSFLDEKKYFRSGARLPDFSTNGRWQDVGHYTQMIWRGTRRLGCALGDGRNYEYLVCRYFPAGNIFGKGPFDEEMDGATVAAGR